MNGDWTKGKTINTKERATGPEKESAPPQDFPVTEGPGYTTYIYTPEDIESVTKTFRPWKHTRANDLFLQLQPACGSKVLDFGSGKGAPQTEQVKGSCYRDVKGYDFSCTEPPNCINLEAVRGFNADYVIASSVINVWEHEEGLRQTLRDMKAGGNRDATYIIGYPEDPRKLNGMGNTDMRKILESEFVITTEYRDRGPKAKGVRFQAVEPGTRSDKGAVIWLCKRI